MVGGVALDAVHGGRVRQVQVLPDVVGVARRRPAGGPGCAAGRAPVSVMPVTVQVIRFATPRSGSLRRVMTWSPAPMRSPSEPWVMVVSSTAPAVTRWSRTTSLTAAAASLVSTATACGTPSRCRSAVCTARWASASASLSQTLTCPPACRSSNTALGVDRRSGSAAVRSAYSVSRCPVGGAEPVHRAELDLGGRPAGDHVQDAAAADRRQLPAVPDVHHAGVGVVGDVQQRAGGFLVQHPGLVDHQHVPRATAARWGAARCTTCPVTGSVSPGRSRVHTPSSSHRYPCW